MTAKRKRKPTRKLLENGDPPLQSKRRRVPAHDPEHDENISDDEIEIVHKCSSPQVSSQVSPRNVEPSDDSSDSESARDSPNEDSDAELERLKHKWTSSVYAFFKQNPKIEYENGARIHVFECTANPCRGKGKSQKFVRRNLSTRDATSTSNLRKHAMFCWGKEAVEAACKSKSVHEARNILNKMRNGSTTMRDGSLVVEFERIGKGKVTYSHRPPSQLEIRTDHVLWMTESRRAFNTVNDKGYHRVMKSGRPAHYIPSASTVGRDIRKSFEHCREKVAKLLQEQEGDLSFAIDAWTSPNSWALVAVTVHYEDKGQASTWLLDIVEVAESHTGASLAAAFEEVVDSLGISDKVLSITCDNASANDSMVEHLDQILTSFSGEAARTRCFAHVLNLIAKSVITQFDAPKKGNGIVDQDLDNEVQGLVDLVGDIDNEEEDERRQLMALEQDGPDDTDGWVNERESMTTRKVHELERDLMPARRVLAKLRKISFAVKHSSTRLLPRWREICKEQHLKVRVMPRDVKTRWNSTYDMLVFAIDYQRVIDQITGERESNLRSYELQRSEWKVAVELRDALKVFKDATLFFSRETAPNLAMVIPAMDHIDEVLTMTAFSTRFSTAVSAALDIGKRTLNRYYSKTDFSETYRIAMVLHPRHKLNYFQDAKWPDDWIETAETLVRTNYNKKYKHIGSSDETSDPSNVNQDSISRSTNIFDNLPALAAPRIDLTLDEVTRYLQAPPENTAEPLLWWYERQQLYPGLSRMARDYLSIPATSVNVERVFSSGRMLLSYQRNRLNVDTTRALLCVGEWKRKGIIKEKDIHTALKDLPEVREGEDDDEVESEQ